MHENGPFSHYTVLSRKLFDYKSLNEKDVCLNNCFISVVNQSHGSLLHFSSLAIKGLLSVNLVSEKKLSGNQAQLLVEPKHGNSGLPMEVWPSKS